MNILLKFNILRYVISVWSTSMILASNARGRKFDYSKKKKLFYFLYVCLYLLLKSNILRYVMNVWSSGMILTSSARGGNCFLFFICMYVFTIKI